MVNGSRYYRALESVSIAPPALSGALTIYPCQIRIHQTLTVLNSNFLGLQLGRRSGGRPQRTVYPRRLPVSCDTHTTLAGIEPTTFRLLVNLVRRATSGATETVRNHQSCKNESLIVPKALFYKIVFCHT